MIMKAVVFVAFAVASVSLASCANTVRGIGKDTRQTASAVQDSTDGVLKAGAKGNKAAQ